MQRFKHFISQFPNYKPVYFEKVKPHLSMISIDAGEYFLQQNKIARKLAFIESGLMRQFYLNEEKEVTTCFCKEDTIATSYSSLITKTPSKIAIQAIESCTLTVIAYDALQEIYTAEPFWQQVGRLASESEYVNTECHKHFINDLTATQRYQEVLSKDADLLQRVPLIYLASYLQIAPETLSRIRKKISRT